MCEDLIELAARTEGLGVWAPEERKAVRLTVLGLLASFAFCYVIIGCPQDSGRMGWKSREAFIDAMISRFSQLAKPQRPCISLDSRAARALKFHHASICGSWIRTPPSHTRDLIDGEQGQHGTSSQHVGTIRPHAIDAICEYTPQPAKACS